MVCTQKSFFFFFLCWYIIFYAGDYLQIELLKSSGDFIFPVTKCIIYLYSIIYVEKQHIAMSFLSNIIQS